MMLIIDSATELKCGEHAQATIALTTSAGKKIYYMSVITRQSENRVRLRIYEVSTAEELAQVLAELEKEQIVLEPSIDELFADDHIDA